MDVVTLGAALSIMKKMPDTAASSAATAEDAADRAEEAARTLTIDDTLSESGQAADSKAVGDALAEKLDIADLPDTVSNANQLLSEKYTVDTEPYHFRPSGGNGADRAFDTIVGGSVVWNQLYKNGDHSNPSQNEYATGGTVDIVDGVLEYTIGTPANNTYSNIIYRSIIIPPDHVVLIIAKVNLAHSVTNIPVWIVGGGANQSLNLLDHSGNKGISGNTWTTVGCVFRRFDNAAPGETYIQMLARNPVTNGYSEGDVDKINDIMCFDLTQMFGSEIADYIYNLEQTTPGAGVAWFRKYFPNDYYDYNTGELMHVSGVSAHKCYDAEENVIATYPLDSSLTLRGIPKLVDGKLSFDGDVYKPDGTVERRYGIVDLGTLSWVYNSANIAFAAIELNSLIKKTASDTDAPKFIQNKYNQLPRNQLVPGTSDKVICENSTGAIVVSDLSYTNAETFKAAVSGVYLVYELATTTTEEAEPFQSPQILNPYGTEEYVTTSLVPVGHETKYPENLRAKIEGLPWNFASLIAPVEAEFKATRNYTSGSLFIVNNTLYKATANIANGGTITPNTNCTATTLAEIIAAL